ncbi:MAG: hypothetical protein QOF98_991, partial [Streptomyces sp.]|nr:hypothetical protein [Streptomyces sp.]
MGAVRAPKGRGELRDKPQTGRWARDDHEGLGPGGLAYARGMSGGRPVGTVTRGTTNPNRLRRMDRWIVATHGWELRGAADPLAVDLGYGAAPWTAVELLGRLRGVWGDAQVVGVEIDPGRVAAAQAYAREGLEFRHGG